MRKLALCLAMIAAAVLLYFAVRPGRQDFPGSIRDAIPPSRISRTKAVVSTHDNSTLAQEPYVGSDACRKCHSDQHESWHRSYHRSMTMVATAENILAPFDVELTIAGQEYRLFTKANAQGEKTYWVESDDPEWERGVFQTGQDVRNANAPQRRTSQVVMTTGSHHFQAYWIRSDYGRELWQFPLRYDLVEKNWVHRKDVFLGPPEWRPGMHFKVWNDNCIFCHATGGQPGRDAQSNLMEHTSIAELGIACESCHGPGREHIEKHAEASDKQLAATKATNAASAHTDDSIVNPAKLDHELASEVCGACHSNFLHDDPNVMVTGPKFRPGRRLTEFGRFFTPPLERESDIVSRFWSDGTNRSTGREFMGLKTSPCYRQGEISCLSCHSMHDSDPDGQLLTQMKTNAACVQCHEAYGDPETLQQHTHHGPNSAGSLCYNCHMPYTNYGLFKATRSHAISNPKANTIEHKSKPNACNLCHLDKSLRWTAKNLNEWFDHDVPELQADELDTPAWVLLALRGDAGQRAIAAWHPRWQPAQETSGTEWLKPFLSELENDDYSAVAYVAKASAKRLPLQDGSRSGTQLSDLGLGDSATLKEFISELLERRDNKPIASVE